MGHSPEREALKKLFALSGNKCMFPDCDAKIVDYEHNTLLGEVCHIKGRHPSAPRYDKNQTEKNSFENLMVLCPSHHKIIDLNPEKYTVEVLQKMKKDHESRIGAREVVEEWVVDRLIDTKHLE